MTLVAVMLGAALGAPMRYLIDRAVQSRHNTGFPWGTFTVNVLACLVLGVVTGAAVAGSLPPVWRALLATGLCGALSTYSTFAYETMWLTEQGQRVHAVANVVASVTAGIGAAFLGMAVADALW